MKPNAYTVGNAHPHDAALRQAEPLFKRKGSMVFRSEQEADQWIQKHLEITYRVYGLVLPNGWDQDVQLTSGEDHYRLVNDARVLSLESKR